MSELLEMSEFIELCSPQEPEVAFSIISSIQEILDVNEFTIVDWIENPQPLVNFVYDKKRDLLHVKSLFKAFISAESIIAKLLSCWLVPSKILPIYAQTAHSFKDKKRDFRYCFSSLTLKISQGDWGQIDMMLSIVLGELKIGLLSYYHAKRILDMKALSFDQKNLMIQESIIKRLQKFSRFYDYDIFTLMQRFFLAYSPTFCSFRSNKHLLDTILSLYYCQISVKNQMLSDSSSFSSHRHLSIKIQNHQVQGPLGYYTHQSIVVSFSLLDKKEVFEKDHFFRAIQSVIKGVEYIEDSFFSHKDIQNSIGVFAIEIRSDNSSFTQKQKDFLTQKLKDQIQNFIQTLVNPVFMPLNEEEVMKNIVQLSNEIRSHKDIPQMMLNFEKQDQGNLYYRAVLVRIIEKNSPSMATLFMRSKKRIKVLAQREKLLPFGGGAFQKEIGVFRVELKSQSFLRQDFSVDVFKAREGVCDFFKSILGDIRDFNGAMLSFEINAFNDFSRSIKRQGFTQKNLMEQFYYSIYPAQKRLVVSSKILKNLFIQFYQKFLERSEKTTLVSQESIEKEHYVVLKLRLEKKGAFLLHKIKEYNHTFDVLITFYLQVSNHLFVGAVFEKRNYDEMQLFIKHVKEKILLDS